jgi:hypothetical protein
MMIYSRTVRGGFIRRPYRYSYDEQGPNDEQGPYDEDRTMSKDRTMTSEDRMMTSEDRMMTSEDRRMSGHHTVVLNNNFVIGHDLSASLNLVICV